MKEQLHQQFQIDGSFLHGVRDDEELLQVGVWRQEGRKDGDENVTQSSLLEQRTTRLVHMTTLELV